MEQTKTERGFAMYEFKDRNGVPCSLQKSSVATEDCIWLGVDDAAPKVMAIHAAGLGIQTQEITGWVDYPLPKEVSLRTRMHLNQEQARALIPILQAFADGGELSPLTAAPRPIIKEGHAQNIAAKLLLAILGGIDAETYKTTALYRETQSDIIGLV